MMYIIDTYSEIHKTVSYSYIHIMMHIWGYINDDVYQYNSVYTIQHLFIYIYYIHLSQIVSTEGSDLPHQCRLVIKFHR